jgi:hypothetical protein
LGEVLESERHLRRAGIPCGYSAYLNYIEFLSPFLRNAKDKLEERDSLNSAFYKILSLTNLISNGN